MSNLTRSMREKYQPRERRDGLGGQGLFRAFPPGGRDIHTLCDAIDKLERLVRREQGAASVDRMNEIERELFTVLQDWKK